MASASTSYDQLLQQVESLKAENSHLKQVGKLCCHICRLLHRLHVDAHSLQEDMGIPKIVLIKLCKFQSKKTVLVLKH